VKRRLIVSLVLALGGCAPAARPATQTPSATRAAEQASAEVESRDAEALAQAQGRVRELEAQLGLARAEARSLRGDVEAMREAEATRSVRIAERCVSAEEEEPTEDRPTEDQEAWEPPASQAQAPRPVLRLYGTARPAASSDVAVLPGPDAPIMVEAPPAAAVRLPVDESVPAIPLQPVTVAPALESAAPASAQTAVVTSPRGVQPELSDPGVVAYRAALAHLTARQAPEALAGFEAFLRDHPRHPYADNAMYWRAEIHYMRRDHRRALRAFSALIERYPHGNKVPDALLRIGLCYERLGQRDRARRVFERLRAQYPDSMAARMASREDA